MADKKGESKRMEVFLRRFFNRYFVFRSFSALTLFILSFGFFSFLLKRASDLGRVVIALYGFLIVVFCVALIAEYLIKTVSLQRIERVRSYSSIVAVNTVFGLIMPLIYTNVVLAVVIRALAQIKNYGTFFCDVRCSIVGFYYNNQIYTQLNTVIFWLILMTAALFIFGGLIERIGDKR